MKSKQGRNSFFSWQEDLYKLKRTTNVKRKRVLMQFIPYCAVIGQAGH